MKKLKSYYSTKSPNHSVSVFYGQGSVDHCRLRMGLSALNHQRFSYNLIPEGKSIFCTYNETVRHFFLEYPSYTHPRIILLRELARILPLSIIKSNRRIIDVILDTKCKSYICKAVHQFKINSVCLHLAIAKHLPMVGHRNLTQCCFGVAWIGFTGGGSSLRRYCFVSRS